MRRRRKGLVHNGIPTQHLLSEILRRVALRRAQYDESCKLCSGGNQSGDLRGGGLPCGGCQRFESAYLQLVNLADTKLYDSTQFFRFGGSIYDLSFMDVDKIHPFSNTLGWHSLKIKGEIHNNNSSSTGLNSVQFWLEQFRNRQKAICLSDLAAVTSVTGLLWLLVNSCLVTVFDFELSPILSSKLLFCLNSRQVAAAEFFKVQAA
ncbi:hypothetical protein Ccrd_024790, partial [Cynara cardunculus var. scolymus]